MGSEVEATATQGDVFRLSFISNVLSDIKSGTAAELANIAAAEIPKRMAKVGLSGWSVTWGPMVFKDVDVDAGGPDLVAYVAKKSDTYVVAIAGTHEESDRAKTVYDIKIQKSVDFEAWRNQSGAVASAPKIEPTANPDKANVSEGTALGVYDLARTKTILGPSPGTNIVTYLKSLEADKPGFNLIYTGHSLGGALSPTLALGLLKELKNINPKSVSTLPTAGPAPGNKKFVDLFTDAFKAGGGFNTNIINTRDPVTFAWSIDSTNSPKRCMQYLRELFGLITPRSPQLYTVLVGFQTNASFAQKNHGMTYVFLPSTPFTGTNPLPHKLPSDLIQYKANTLVAHIDDYKTKWGIKAGELDDITVAFPFPIGPESAEYYGESAFDSDGNYIGPKDAASANGETTNENSEL